MRPRLRSAAAFAALVLGPCSLAATWASGCNAFSGIGDFVVDSEGGADGTLGEGASGHEEGGGGNVDAPVDATQDAGEAGNDATKETGSEAATDAGADADGGDGGCAIAHSDGLGQTFFDCVPLGTHNQAQAFEACAAFTGNMSLCVAVGCAPGNEVCSTGFTSCACWKYQGNNVGHVSSPGATGEGGSEGGICICPNAASPTWN
jgi:hypothetical protein